MIMSWLRNPDEMMSLLSWDDTVRQIGFGNYGKTGNSSLGFQGNWFVPAIFIE